MRAFVLSMVVWGLLASLTFVKSDRYNDVILACFFVMSSALYAFNCCI